jgi:hypothetical protein
MTEKKKEMISQTKGTEPRGWSEFEVKAIKLAIPSTSYASPPS